MGAEEGFGRFGVLECEEPDAMTLGIAADAPVVLWYRVERNNSGREFSLAGVQRLSRRTVTPLSQTAYRGQLLQTKFGISKSAQNRVTQDEMHRRSTLRERHR
jgi:hypothetical protein